MNEKSEVITNYFAFYDGEKLAIGKPLSGLFSSRISQDNYSAYRIGSTFSFFENHVLNDRYEVGVSDTRVASPGGNNIVWVPRQIDMETGECY